MQTYFLFRSQLPESHDADSGISSPKTKKTLINGIYYVAKVTHEFSNGKFTQTLHAYRDLRVNINNLQWDEHGNPIVVDIDFEAVNELQLDGLDLLNQPNQTNPLGPGRLT